MPELFLRSDRIPAPGVLPCALTLLETIVMVGHPFCERLHPPIPATGPLALVTPVYLTNGRLERSLAFLESTDRVEAVFLRDVGLLRACARRFPEKARIWDRWWWGRDETISDRQLETIAELGASAIEIPAAHATAEMLERLKARELTGVADVAGRPVSFSPRCYTTEITGLTCGSKKPCEDHSLEIDVEGVPHTARGHELGQQPAFTGRVAEGWSVSY